MRDLRAYNRRLQRRHPLVRVRWSDLRKVYLVEEKAAYGRLDLDPRTYPPDALDTYVQHKDGYMPLGAMRQLPVVSQLVDRLTAGRVEAFMARAGARTADELADKLDAEDEAKREARSRAFRGEVDQIASSEYDAAQWRTGSRVAVPR